VSGQRALQLRRVRRSEHKRKNFKEAFFSSLHNYSYLLLLLKYLICSADDYCTLSIVVVVVVVVVVDTEPHGFRCCLWFLFLPNARGQALQPSSCVRGVFSKLETNASS